MLHIKATVCSGLFLRESNFQLTAGNNLAHDNHALLPLLTIMYSVFVFEC